MYGFIFGFQRWVWWPKWAPASSNCCMLTSVDAMVFLLPVMPLQGRETCLCLLARAGTGMMALHVGWRAPRRSGRQNQGLTSLEHIMNMLFHQPDMDQIPRRGVLALWIKKGISRDVPGRGAFLHLCLAGG